MAKRTKVTTRSRDKGNGWQEGTCGDFWWQAKVYDEGSEFGIRGGRVSKLTICAGKNWNPDAQVYNYDRGLDFDNCPSLVLSAILNHCEMLPTR